VVQKDLYRYYDRYFPVQDLLFGKEHVEAPKAALDFMAVLP
jgi:hypothetical protein